MKSSITKKKRIWIGTASVVLLLVVWKLASLHYKSDFILPSPEKTIISLFDLFTSTGFLVVVGSTLWRGLLGFVSAAVVGIALGIAAGVSPSFRAALAPVLVVVRSIPIIAITLLSLIWFTPEGVPLFIGFLTMFPIICTNVIEGIRSVDGDLVEMAELYNLSSRRKLSELYIPSIAPFIFSGFSTMAGIGWRAIIVGEVLSQPEYGIGTLMHSAQTFLNVDVLIAWTLIAILLSSGCEALISFCGKKVLKWREK